MTAPSWRVVAGYLAARAVPAFASMATMALCVQVLSAEDYAIFSLTALPAAVVAGFAGAACGQALLRFSKELSARSVRQGLHALPLVYGALGALAVMAYFAWSGRLSMTAVWAAVWAALSVPAMVLIDARRGWFIARGEVAQVFRLDVSRAALVFALTLLLLFGWAATPAAPLVAAALAAWAAVLWVRTSNVSTPNTSVRTIDRDYLAHGLGLAVWLAVILVLSLAERTLVANVVGLAAAGRYAAQADMINAVFAAAGSALAASMTPHYLDSVAQKDAAAQRRLLRHATGAVAGMALLCIGIAAALGALGSVLPPSRLIDALSGNAAAGLWLVAAASVWTWAGFVQKPLELGGRARHLVFAVLGALLLFAAAAPGLTREFGAPGPAAAKLAAGLLFTAWVAVAGRSAR
jgi:hypothetical protein